MQAASDLLASINLFKTPVRLTINSKDYYSSSMGEILSFAIYAYLLFSLITSDAFTKKNPNVLEKEVDNELTFWYNFTEENFVFCDIIADNYGRS